MIILYVDEFDEQRMIMLKLEMILIIKEQLSHSLR